MFYMYVYGLYIDPIVHKNHSVLDDGRLIKKSLV